MTFALSLAVSMAVVLVQAAYATSVLDAGPMDLFHASRQTGARDCNTVRIPWNLCPACKLLPFTGTGNKLDFGGVNRFDIYDVNSTSCRRMIQKYVDANPCDQTRANAFANMDDPTKPGAYLAMIYFMYSSCETCCDCIPIGSRVEQYEERKANGTLINIFRGNCAAHFHYDTCKIWPNLGQITGLNGMAVDLPKPCPDFRVWQKSDASKGWLRNNNVTGVTWKMRRAMNMMVNKGRCREEGQWKKCIGMELAQGRL